MRVKVAQGAGFCFGVKRAVQMAVEAAGQGMVCSLGPLIHRLSSLVRVIDSLEEVACTNTAEAQPLPKVVIRSHGVGPQVYAQAEKLGLQLVDATCPFVQKAQRAAQQLYKDGWQVVIVGDQNHPEVAGIKAWTADTAWVAANAVEAAALPDLPKAALGLGLGFWLLCGACKLNIPKFAFVILSAGLRAKGRKRLVIWRRNLI